MDATLAEIRDALAAGAALRARALLEQRRVRVVGADDVLTCAEVLEASGSFRRARALRRLGHRRHPDHAALRVARARDLVDAGRLREAQRLVEHLDGDAGRCLRGRIAGTPTPGIDVAAVVDVDAALDAALSLPRDDGALARLRALQERFPHSARARLLTAARLRDHGAIDEAHALLKAGARGGREDARVELAFALSLFHDGRLDEACLAAARLRARFPALAQRSDLRLLLACATWFTGRNADARALIPPRDTSAAEDALAVLLDGALAPPAALVTPAPPGSAALTPPTTTRDPSQEATLPASPSATPPKQRPRVSADWQRLAIDDGNHRRSPWLLLATGAVLAALLAVAIPRFARAPRPVVDAGGPPPTLSDAGVVDDDMTVHGVALAERVQGCGLEPPPPIDVGSAALADLAGRRFQGQPLTPARFPVNLPPDVFPTFPGLRVINLAGIGKARLGAVLGPDGGAEVVVGYAFFGVDEQHSTPLRRVMSPARVGFDRVLRETCGGRPCHALRRRCGDVDIVARARCPANVSPTSPADLADCALDTLLVLVGVTPP